MILRVGGLLIGLNRGYYRESSIVSEANMCEV